MILKTLSTKLAKPRKSRIKVGGDNKSEFDSKDKVGSNKVEDKKVEDNKVARKKNY